MNIGYMNELALTAGMYKGVEAKKNKFAGLYIYIEYNSLITFWSSFLP